MKNIWIKKNERRILGGFYNQLDDVWVVLQDATAIKKVNRVAKNEAVLILKENDFIAYTEKFVAAF